MSWVKSVLIRVTDAILLSMDLRAKAALRSMTVFRSALVLERQRPR